MKGQDLDTKEIDLKDEILKKKWIELPENIINLFDDLAKNKNINASGSKGAIQTTCNLFAAGKFEALIRYYYAGNVPPEWQEAFTLVAKRQAKK